MLRRRDIGRQGGGASSIASFRTSTADCMGLDGWRVLLVRATGRRSWAINPHAERCIMPNTNGNVDTNGLRSADSATQNVNDMKTLAQKTNAQANGSLSRC